MFPLFFIFLIELICVPQIGELISDQYLDKYEEFEFSIPLSTFESSKDKSTSVFMSLTPNKWIVSSFINPEVVGKYEYIDVQELFVTGDYVFVADGTYGLMILTREDISSEFVIVGAVEIADPRGVFVQGSYAYVADYNYGLKIVDCEDPSQPQIVGEVVLTRGYDVTVEGDFAFIGGADEIVVVNITIKSHPDIVGRVETISSPRGIFVVGNYAFVADLNTALVVVDITNLTNPYINATLDTGGQSHRVFVNDDDVAYVSLGGGGIAIIDVSTPGSPTLLKEFSLPGGGTNYEVVASGDYAYVTDTTDGLRIVDISDVFNPVVVHSIPTEYCRSLYLHDNLLYVGMEYDGLMILNITANDGNPPVVFTQNSNTGRNALSVQLVRGRYLFVSDSVQGLKVLDAIVYENPKLIGMYRDYDLPFKPSESFVVEHDKTTTSHDDIIRHHNMYVYVLQDQWPGDFVVFNVTITENEGSSSSSASIEWLGNVEIQNNMWLAIDDAFEFAYVAHLDGIKVVEFSDRTDPQIVGDIIVDQRTYCLFFSSSSSSGGEEKFLYAIRQYEPRFAIYNVTNITDIFEVSSLVIGIDSTTVIVDGNYAYVTCTTDGMKIVDITDKENPTLVGNFDTGDAMGVAVAGISSSNQFAFIADNENGVNIVDISDRTNPLLSLSLSSSSDLVKGVFVKDNFMYLAVGERGIRIVRFELKCSGASESFSYFCGEAVVQVNAAEEDGVVVSQTFTLSRDDYCNHHGECLPNSQCVCSPEFQGERCESWSCHSVDFKKVSEVCGGHGECISPDECKCHANYAGSKCKTNMLYYTAMTPALSVAGIGLVLLICGAVCCICMFCLLCFVTLIVFLCCAFGLVVKQTKGLKRFSRLQNFDLLLKEQELDEDTTIAHLRINKGLFEIPFDEIKTISILGEGGSNSIVFKADWKNTVVAFKCFKTRQLMNSQDKFDEFEREVEILGSLSHPNIIRFYGASMQKPRVGIVMEFACNGEILDYVKKFRDESGSAYPLFQKLRMLHQIASAMLFLHSRSIIHRDLKSENVLIDEKENTKLMDFGLSRLVDAMSVAKTLRVGTSVYMAPEIVTDDKYTEKCDVFSFAILFHILLTEDPNPYGSDVYQVEMKVANDPSFRPKLTKLSFLKDEKAGDQYEWITKTIENAWNHNPDARYSFKDLCDIIGKGLEGSKDTANYWYSTSINDDDGGKEQESPSKGRTSQKEEKELFKLSKKDLVSLLLKSRKDLMRLEEANLTLKEEKQKLIPKPTIRGSARRVPSGKPPPIPRKNY